MDNSLRESFYNLINYNNQDILSGISNKLEIIVSELANGRQISGIIKQIKNIILIINKIYNDNKKNIDIIRNDIKNLNDNISKTLKILLSKNNESEGFVTKTVTYVGGDKYVGQFKNGVREGKGIYYYANGAKYEGDFKNGFAEGKGNMIYSSGTRYTGDWKNDIPEGKGIFYYSNESYYEGE